MKKETELKEEIEKLTNLMYAIINLENVRIPYNIIKNYIIPLKEWLEEELQKLNQEKKNEKRRKI